jgi:gliding motility-associated-like protein
MKNKIITLLSSILPLFGFSQIDTTGAVPADYDSIQFKDDITIYAPNAFTPDEKLNNNTWTVYTYGINIYRYHLTVYNRNGEVVWESYDPGASWDGTYGGYNLVPTDVYVWRLVTRSPLSDKMYLFKGFVIVLY